MKYIISTLILSLACSQSTFAAPLTFNTALPVSQGEIIFREQFVLIQSDDDIDLGRDRTEMNLVSTFVYGITPDLAIFGSFPLTHRTLDMGMGKSRSSTGLADSRVLIRYIMYKEDFFGGSFRIAPFAGLKLPTGTDAAKDSLGQLPRPVQNGSGSVDMFGGVVATYATLNWEVDAQLSYQNNSEKNSFKAGDVLRADVSYQHRLFPAVNSSGENYRFNGVLEANFINKENNKITSMSDPNTGGTTLFIVPGLQYITEEYIVEISLQIPVSQNLNGMALENDYILRTGFRINF